jgi:hypothetical protein
LAAAGFGVAVLVGGVLLAQPASAAVTNPGGIGSPAVVAGVGPGTYPQDVFEIGLDHQVVRWHTADTRMQVTGWETLGGYATDGVAAVLQGERETVFTRGRDGAVWYRERTGTAPWGGWQSLGGRILGRPTAMLAGDLVVVAVRAPNGAMYDRDRTVSGWTPRWRLVGGQLLGSPALGAVGYSVFAAFAVGRDSRLWLTTRADSVLDTWAPWRRLPDPPARVTVNGDPGAIPTAGVVFVRGQDGSCWMYDSGAWPAWRPLGGRFSSGFAGDMGQDLTLFIYGRGTNGKLYYQVRPLTASTGRWLPLGG